MTQEFTDHLRLNKLYNKILEQALQYLSFITDLWPWGHICLYSHSPSLYTNPVNFHEAVKTSVGSFSPNVRMICFKSLRLNENLFLCLLSVVWNICIQRRRKFQRKFFVITTLFSSFISSRNHKSLIYSSVHPVQTCVELSFNRWKKNQF